MGIILVEKFTVLAIEYICVSYELKMLEDDIYLYINTEGTASTAG